MCCKGCPLDIQGNEKLDELKEVIGKYPAGAREFLIPLLQDTQERFSFLSRQAMTEIARHVGIPLSKVYGVATFYNQFKLIAPGKHQILVCRGTACHVRGSDQILKIFEAELGIKCGTTTRDGLFSLDMVACLGSCSIAPVITVDGTFHGRLATGDVAKVIGSISDGTHTREG